MLKALWFVLKLGAFIALALWLLNQQGNFSLSWYYGGDNYTATGNVGLVLLGVMILVMVTILLYRSLSALMTLPNKIIHQDVATRYEKGQRAVTMGLSAVASGDVKMARYYAYRAKKIMPDNSGLPLLLEAQSARMQNLPDLAHDAYEKLAESKEAGFIGFRGLIQSALEKNDQDQAQELITSALKRFPKNLWILKVAYFNAVDVRQWDAALGYLYRAEKIKALDSERCIKDRIAIRLQQHDEALLKGLHSEASDHVKAAYRLSKDFVPTVLRLARFYLHKNNKRKALSIVKAAWKTNPHPDLIDIWQELSPAAEKTSPARILHWYEKLLALNPKSVDAQLAVAKAAISNRLWGEAENYLKMAEQIEKSKSVYMTWADMKRLSGASQGTINHYLQNAADAPPENAWICRLTGQSYDEWSAIALPHGAFNTMIWATPGQSALHLGDKVLMAPSSLNQGANDPIALGFHAVNVSS